MLDRESSSDMLMSSNGASIRDFPVNSVIGSSSPRRKSQVNNIRPDINVVPVRGNIETRIKKLNDGQFDGLIVAKAALNRLEIDTSKCYEFTKEEMLPSASQGYIAIECLKSNLEILNIVRKINNEKQMILAQAERSFVSALNGSCLSPIAVLCSEEENNILISAKVLSQDGKDKIYKEINSSYENTVSYTHLTLPTT